MKSGLYASAGASATAKQAALAKRLLWPTTKLSNVYRGLSGICWLWDGDASVARGGAASRVGAEAGAGVAGAAVHGPDAAATDADVVGPVPGIVGCAAAGEGAGTGASISFSPGTTKCRSQSCPDSWRRVVRNGCP